MIEQVLAILQKYDYDYSKIHMSLDLKDIVIQVERDLIFSSISSDVARNIMGELWQLQRTTSIHFIKHNVLNIVLDEISQKPHYHIHDNFVVYDNFIKCTAIKTENAFYILNENQIQKVISLGYGVRSFKIEINKTIRDIYCTGSHPNLNSLNGSFCIDNDMKDVEFTITNLELVEEMLSQINLRSCFLNQAEYNRIVEVVE